MIGGRLTNTTPWDCCSCPRCCSCGSTPQISFTCASGCLPTAPRPGGRFRTTVEPWHAPLCRGRCLVTHLLYSTKLYITRSSSARTSARMQCRHHRRTRCLAARDSLAQGWYVGAVLDACSAIAEVRACRGFETHYGVAHEYGAAVVRACAAVSRALQLGHPNHVAEVCRCATATTCGRFSRPLRGSRRRSPLGAARSRSCLARRARAAPKRTLRSATTSGAEPIARAKPRYPPSMPRRRLRAPLRWRVGRARRAGARARTGGRQWSRSWGWLSSDGCGA